MEEQPELVLGVPARYGGTLPDTPPESSAEHNAFGIQTSAAAAQNVYEQNISAYSAPDEIRPLSQKNN